MAQWHWQRSEACLALEAKSSSKSTLLVYFVQSMGPSEAPSAKKRKDYTPRNTGLRALREGSTTSKGITDISCKDWLGGADTDVSKALAVLVRIRKSSLASGGVIPGRVFPNFVCPPSAMKDIVGAPIPFNYKGQLQGNKLIHAQLLTTCSAHAPSSESSTLPCTCSHPPAHTVGISLQKKRRDRKAAKKAAAKERVPTGKLAGPHQEALKPNLNTAGLGGKGHKQS
eukprot:1160844-Pelagomonas_calceolata.AAC.1